MVTVTSDQEDPEEVDTDEEANYGYADDCEGKGQDSEGEGEDSEESNDDEDE